MAKFMITSIDWETDGEEVSLPTEEIVDGAAASEMALQAAHTRGAYQALHGTLPAGKPFLSQ